jgi:putative flippase GtrA
MTMPEVAPGARPTDFAAEAVPSGATTPAQAPILDVVIPVYNEEASLARCVRRLHHHLRTTMPYSFRITIADNASTDATLAIAGQLADELPGVRVRHLTEKGRGRALRTAWSESDASVLAYMDVDLSTDLAALLPLVAPLVSGHSEVAIGTRLARGSRVVRGFKREAISRGYNLLLRSTLAARFSDAQCGFKAIRRDVAEQLLPMVADPGWFFDTELLVLAQRAGLRIHEVPVDWVDDPDSRVDIVATALADLRGIARLGRALAAGRVPLAEVRRNLGRAPQPVANSVSGQANVPATNAPVRTRAGLWTLARQLGRFALIGVVSTVAYLLIYSLLRLGLAAQAANALALLVTAIGNTAANRRLTFGIAGRRHAGRHHLHGLLAFALGLAITSGALMVLHALTATPARALELAVLVGANLVATVVRFLLLRFAMHHRRG